MLTFPKLRPLLRVIAIASAHDSVQPNKGLLSTILPRTDMHGGNGFKLVVTLNIRKLPSGEDEGRSFVKLLLDSAIEVAIKGREILALVLQVAARESKLSIRIHQNGNRQVRCSQSIRFPAHVFTHAVLRHGHAIEVFAVCQTLYFAQPPDLLLHFSSNLCPRVDSVVRTTDLPSHMTVSPPPEVEPTSGPTFQHRYRSHATAALSLLRSA